MGKMDFANGKWILDFRKIPYNWHAKLYIRSIRTFLVPKRQHGAIIRFLFVLVRRDV